MPEGASSAVNGPKHKKRKRRGGGVSVVYSNDHFLSIRQAVDVHPEETKAAFRKDSVLHVTRRAFPPLQVFVCTHRQASLM